MLRAALKERRVWLLLLLLIDGAGRLQSLAKENKEASVVRANGPNDVELSTG